MHDIEDNHLPKTKLGLVHDIILDLSYDLIKTKLF
jgi:hypothetical protein